MRKLHLVNGFAAACAAALILGTPALAATGSAGQAARAPGPAATSASGSGGTGGMGGAGRAAPGCWSDRDHDNRNGHPDDHDGDEAARCHAAPMDADHDSYNVSDMFGDGDRDADDPVVCWPDGDRGDWIGDRGDSDGGESARCYR